MPKLYYTPPPVEQFDELKKECIKIWSVMGDEPSYSKEKIARIENIANIGDNFMYMVAMFDHGNQHILAHKLSEQTRKSVRDRMIDGGHPIEFISF